MLNEVRRKGIGTGLCSYVVFKDAQQGITKGQKQHSERTDPQNCLKMRGWGSCACRLSLVREMQPISKAALETLEEEAGYTSVGCNVGNTYTGKKSIVFQTTILPSIKTVLNK